tara:strand:- start:22 stop:204 length:183 start_codon:yes stop_codon:yes gene_type:complete
MKFIFYGASRVRRGEKTRDRFVVVLFVVVAFFLQRSKDAMKFLTTFCHLFEEEEEDKEED